MRSADAPDAAALAVLCAALDAAAVVAVAAGEAVEAAVAAAFVAVEAARASLGTRRAACMVRERATHAADPDASMEQRVSRAVTDAFVAAQVGDIIDGLDDSISGKEAAILRKLYTLVVPPAFSEDCYL